MDNDVEEYLRQEHRDLLILRRNLEKCIAKKKELEGVLDKIVFIKAKINIEE